MRTIYDFSCRVFNEFSPHFLLPSLTTTTVIFHHHKVSFTCTTHSIVCTLNSNKLLYSIYTCHVGQYCRIFIWRSLFNRVECEREEHDGGKEIRKLENKHIKRCMFVGWLRVLWTISFFIISHTLAISIYSSWWSIQLLFEIYNSFLSMILPRSLARLR